jgi:hypothetical protein
VFYVLRFQEAFVSKKHSNFHAPCEIDGYKLLIMATEVQLDPAFNLQPDRPVVEKEQPLLQKRMSKTRSLISVFKKNKNAQYEAIDDTPRTAPSTPDGPIDLTVNPVSSDPALAFDSDDDGLLIGDVPDIFPHEHQQKKEEMAPEESQSPAMELAQFKVPIATDPASAPEKTVASQNVAILDPVKDESQSNQMKKASGNKSVEDDEVFCGYMNGFWEEPKGSQLNTAGSKDESTVYNKAQQAIISNDTKPNATSTGEDFPRHENFEVVLDPSYYNTPEKGFNDVKRQEEDEKKGEEEEESFDAQPGIPVKHSRSLAKRLFSNRKNSEDAQDALEIQRDLEGFEKQMKEGTKQETTNENSASEQGEIARNRLVQILVEAAAAATQKEQKDKKSKKLSLGKLTKKMKALSSKMLSSTPPPPPSPPPPEEDEPVKPTKPKATWKAVDDKNTGKTYYYHRTTRETTWVKPEEYSAYERAMAQYENDRTAYQECGQKREERAEQARRMKEAEEAKAKQEEIRNLLAEASPLDEDKVAVDEVLGQYAGKEDVLLEKLESRPFDEPFDEEPASLATKGRVASHFSTLTEKTQRINNVSNNNRGQLLQSVSEDHSSISSQNNSEQLLRPVRRVPSRLNTHRTRELMVEDLSSSRISAETYDLDRRIVKGRDIPFHEDMFEEEEKNIAPPYEKNRAQSFEHDDSVSALSEMDNDYNMRKENFNQARRRALDNAIEREDWDLAAALTEGMKNLNSNGDYGQAHNAWNQSEIDKFIANNDWAAVQSYIASMRDKKNAEHGRVASAPVKSSKQTRRGMGSKSRQRDQLSDESWSSDSDEFRS